MLALAPHVAAALGNHHSSDNAMAAVLPCTRSGFGSWIHMARKQSLRGYTAWLTVILFRSKWQLKRRGRN